MFDVKHELTNFLLKYKSDEIYENIRAYSLNNLIDFNQLDNSSYKHQVEYARSCKYKKNQIARNKKMLPLLKEIIAEFKFNNIEYILLKGFFIAELLYNHPEDRYSHDIDILINKNSVLSVYNLLKKMNYKTQETENLYIIIKNIHHLTFIKNGIKIEIHGEAFNPPNIHREFTKLCFKNKLEKRILTESMYVLSLEDTFIHLTVHICIHIGKYLKNGGGAIPIIKINDIALLISKYNDTLNWEYIYITMKQLNALSELYIIKELLYIIYNIQLYVNIDIDTINECESFLDVSWIFEVIKQNLSALLDIRGIQYKNLIRNKSLYKGATFSCINENSIGQKNEFIDNRDTMLTCSYNNNGINLVFELKDLLFSDILYISICTIINSRNHNLFQGVNIQKNTNDILIHGINKTNDNNHHITYSLTEETLKIITPWEFWGTTPSKTNDVIVNIGIYYYNNECEYLLTGNKAKHQHIGFYNEFGYLEFIK